MFPVIHSQLAVQGLHFAWLTLHKGTSGKLEYKWLLFSKNPTQKCLVMEIWGIFSDFCTQGPLMRGTVPAQVRLRAGNIKYEMSAAKYQLLPWFVCHMCQCSLPVIQITRFLYHSEKETFWGGQLSLFSFLLSRNFFWMCVASVFSSAWGAVNSCKSGHRRFLVLWFLGKLSP